MSNAIGKFELDNDAIASFMASTPMKTELGKLAVQLAGLVRSTGPRGSSGEYRQSIKIGKVIVDDLEARISVGSDDQFAHLIEFGSVNNKPYRPLTKAGLQMGLKFEDFGTGGQP